jgi:predicted ATP-dependent serine protease
MASRTSDRLGEAEKLGFQSAIIPKRLRSGGVAWPENIDVIEVRSLSQALKKALVKK